MEQEQKDLYKLSDRIDLDKIKQDKRLIDQTNWTRGLMEVPISQEKKIKNVEEAEKARVRQMKLQMNVEEE